MNILFYHDPPPTISSTHLTWTLGQELILLGHNVMYGQFSCVEDLKGVFDWVYVSGEASHKGVVFARYIGARVHVHLEGLAHWRVGAETAASWGFNNEPT